MTERRQRFDLGNAARGPDCPALSISELSAWQRNLWQRSRSVEEMRRIVDALVEVLDDPELRELRRDLATWIRRAVLPARLPGVEIPELHDLQEAKMLAERAAEWPKEWMAAGYEKGILEGREKGILEGKRTTLIELAEQRFGALKAGHKKRIAKATEDQLKRWLKAVLTASTAEDVFRA